MARGLKEGFGKHGRLAVRTGRRRCGREFGRIGWRQWQLVLEGELGLEQAQGLALGTVVQAIVADLAEAGGQHVQQEAGDERVVEQLSGPRVEHSGKGRQRSQVARIAAEIEQGGRRGVEENRQALTWMVADRAAQGLGHREGDQVVWLPRCNGGVLEIAGIGAMSFPIGLFSFLSHNQVFLRGHFFSLVCGGYLLYLGLAVWGAVKPSRLFFVTLCISLLANMTGCQLNQTLDAIPFIGE